MKQRPIEIKESEGEEVQLNQSNNSTVCLPLHQVSQKTSDIKKYIQNHVVVVFTHGLDALTCILCALQTILLRQAKWPCP